jgi:hypothetical protein
MLSEPKVSALLDFFRNLTPQVLFFGCAVYLSLQIDFQRFSFKGADVRHFFSFAGCVALLLMSFIANFHRFFESFVSGSVEMDEALKALGERNQSMWKAMWFVPKCAWKWNRRVVIEALVVIVLTYAALIPVSLMAAQSAAGIRRAMHQPSQMR